MGHVTTCGNQSEAEIRLALTSSLPSVHVFPQSEVFKALIDVFTPVSKPSNCLAVLVLGEQCAVIYSKNVLRSLGCLA